MHLAFCWVLETPGDLDSSPAPGVPPAEGSDALRQWRQVHTGSRSGAGADYVLIPGSFTHCWLALEMFIDVSGHQVFHLSMVGYNTDYVIIFLF